jgi:hypothetical protein
MANFPTFSNTLAGIRPFAIISVLSLGISLLVLTIFRSVQSQKQFFLAFYRRRQLAWRGVDGSIHIIRGMTGELGVCEASRCLHTYTSNIQYQEVNL